MEVDTGLTDQLIKNNTEAKFKAAVNVIKGLPKDGPFQPSQEMKLQFYGLYKQATEGPCKEVKPSFYQLVAGYKWRAWDAMGDISKEEAMERYVVELKKIVETMSYSSDVATFIEVLGSFYEYVDVPSNNNQLMADKSLPDDNDEEQWLLDHPSRLFDQPNEDSVLPNKFDSSKTFVDESNCVAVKKKDIHNTHSESSDSDITTVTAERSDQFTNGEQIGSNAEQVDGNGDQIGRMAEKVCINGVDVGSNGQEAGSHDLLSSLSNGGLNTFGVITNPCSITPDNLDNLEDPQEPLAETQSLRLQSHTDTDTDEEYSEPLESIAVVVSSDDSFASPLSPGSTTTMHDVNDIQENNLNRDVHHNEQKQHHNNNHQVEHYNSYPQHESNVFQAFTTRSYSPTLLHLRSPKPVCASTSRHSGTPSCGGPLKQSNSYSQSSLPGQIISRPQHAGVARESGAGSVGWQNGSGVRQSDGGLGQSSNGLVQSGDGVGQSVGVGIKGQPGSGVSRVVLDQTIRGGVGSCSGGTSRGGKSMVAHQGGVGGGCGGSGTGDDIVVVMRQMQGDLQQMVRCLESNLNDITQCLAALHNTTLTLQARNNSGGSSGGGDSNDPSQTIAELQRRRRQRQWWPFPELSPRSTFWLLLWPLLLHVIIKGGAALVRFRRKKRMMMM